MDIFENLENLQVSEECFNDIMDIVEDILNESNPKTIGNSTKKRYNNYIEAAKAYKELPTEKRFVDFANASNKLEKNVELANKHYARKGDSAESSFKMKDLQDRNKIGKALDNYAASKSCDAAWCKGGADKKANDEAQKWEERANRYMEKTNTIPRNKADLKRVLLGK